jgi:penicillin amidase
MRWHGIQPARVVDAMLGMAKAQDWESFRESLKHWSAPAQKLIYADIHGNIAYQHIGSVPVRAGHDGSVPLAGTDPRGEWTGVIAVDDLPYSLNPGVDRLVTANDRIVDDSYEHFISREWMNGYRAQRIKQLIDEGHRHTVRDQVAIQADVHSIVADQLIPLLADRELKPITSEGRSALEVLRAWDRELTPGSEGAATWRAFMRALNDETYGFLGDLRRLYLGYSRSGVNGFWSLFGRTTPRLVAAISLDNTSLLALARRAKPVDGLPAGWVASGSWDELISRALDRAGMAMSSPGPLGRSAHKLRLQHPLGVLPVLKAVANARVFDAPGDPDTVWQASAFMNPGNPHAMVGPSHRSVIDLADLDQSVAVLAGGQSGHPASPHYLDQLELWRSGRARPAPWTRAAVESQAAYHQVFEPA